MNAYAQPQPTTFNLDVKPSTNFMADVKAFHEKFGLAYEGPPRRLPPDLEGFRAQFQLEEAIEYQDADTDAKRLDALVDQLYVVFGTAYLHGYDINEAWRRVHEANMKKERAAPDGSNSVRGSSHDVVKPINWVPPDLSDLV